MWAAVGRDKKTLSGFFDFLGEERCGLAWIAKVNTKLYRAYLMKERLRIAIRTKGALALTMLDEWLAWAARCRITAFVELGRKITRNLAGIEAAMFNNLSNALVESTYTKATCAAPHGLRLQPA